jgi:hypothetical protein
MINPISIKADRLGYSVMKNNRETCWIIRGESSKKFALYQRWNGFDERYLLTADDLRTIAIAIDQLNAPVKLKKKAKK